MKDVLQEAANEVLPCKEKKKKSWISEATFKLCQEKCKAKNTNTQRYKELKQEVQKRLPADKQADVDELCETLEKNAKRGKSRQVFPTVREITRKFCPRQVAIKNKDGIKLTYPSEVCSGWKEYCSELYNDNQDNTELEVTEREPPPTMSEVARAIRSLSKHKFPGLDGILVDYFQHA